MPFSFSVLLEAKQIGTPVVLPAIITQRLLSENGMVDRGAPLLRILLGTKEFELRVRFPCYIRLRVEVGQSLDPGALLASGGADGENLPSGFEYLSAHAVNPRVRKQE